MSWRPNLVPADTLAQKTGVKLLLYGPPGTAKTPLVGTAPTPVLLSVENGTKSLRGQRFATHSTRDPKEMLEFIDWALGSKECNQFETICIDSITEVAELILADAIDRRKDPRKAYGDIDDAITPRIKKLCAQPGKHLYMIAQLDTKVYGDQARRWPSMPGKVLSRELPHATDEIYYIDKHVVPMGNGQVSAPTLCFQTFSDPITEARSRAINPETGGLIVAAYEPPHLGQLFRKITGR